MNQWSLHCPRCDKYAGCINNGDHKDYWPTIVANWPAIKPAYEAQQKLKGWTVEIVILIYGPCDRVNDTEVWDFLNEHYEHGIEMVSEYDSYSPVMLVESTL